MWVNQSSLAGNVSKVMLHFEAHAGGSTHTILFLPYFLFLVPRGCWKKKDSRACTNVCTFVCVCQWVTSCFKRMFDDDDSAEENVQEPQQHLIRNWFVRIRKNQITSKFASLHYNPYRSRMVRAVQCCLFLSAVSHIWTQILLVIVW